MKYLYDSSKIFLLFMFSISALFGAEDGMMITPGGPYSEHQPVKQENLEEEIAPPPPPALIDLDNIKKEKKDPKHLSLYLFVFNVVMFTTGLIVVKSISGQKV